jgi:hypothetical protein
MQPATGKYLIVGHRMKMLKRHRAHRRARVASRHGQEEKVANQYQQCGFLNWQ